MCALLRDLQGSLCGLPCNLDEEDLAYKKEEEEEERVCHESFRAGLRHD